MKKIWYSIYVYHKKGQTMFIGREYYLERLEALWRKSVASLVVISSDACSTGYPADDLCNSDSSTDGGFDTCPGGGINVDTCGIVYCDEYGHVERSDDYCVAGTGSDECPDGMPPEDGCAGGVPAEDLCYMHLTGSDECDPSISGSDQGGCKSDSDECSFFGLANACTWGLNKDIAE